MTQPSTTVSRVRWGQTPAGQAIHLYHLTLPGGVQATLTDFGATLVGLRIPDRSGQLADVVLGHDHPAGYQDRAQSPYFGATIGRFANRIAGGRFELHGQAYQIPRNDGPNALHGGPEGFDQQLWQAQMGTDEANPSVLFTRVSQDGEQGFPGNLRVEVRFTLTSDHTLTLNYRAETDAPTVLNLTNHAYWNLAGGAAPDILNHELQVLADEFTPVLAGGIPTGEAQEVAGTPFDLRQPRLLRESLSAQHPQLAVVGGGIDHNYLLRGQGFRPVATLSEPGSGREMQVFTTEPGVQVYTGNFLDGSITGKAGQKYGRHAGLCLETQHFPDSPNHPQFPSTVLEPGQVFTSGTAYAFKVR